MAATKLAEVIEAVSEGIVFLELDDLNELANLHSQLGDVGDWAMGEGRLRTKEATDVLCDIVEKLILNEYSDPSAGLDLITRTVSVFQRLASESTDDSQLDYPNELGLEPSTAPAGDDAAPASEYRFTVQLPPYVDEAIFSEFLGRQIGVLEEVETAILDVEQGKNDSALGELSRHLHTLKGETALLGLSDIEHLCHVAEDLLDRENPADVADRLLALKDWMKNAFDAYAGNGAGPSPPEEIEKILIAGLTTGSEPESAAPEPAAVAPVQEESAPPPSVETAEEQPLEESPFTPGPLTGDPELIADFIVEAAEHLDTSDIQLLTLETDPRNIDAINAVFRAFHTIKGVCGFIALEEMQALAHEAENLLDTARKDVVVLEGPYLDAVFDAIDMLKSLLAHVRQALESNSELPVEPHLPKLLSRLKNLASGSAPPEDGSSPAAAPPLDIGPSNNLGDILIDMGSATPKTIENALDDQENASLEPKKLGEMLHDSALASTAQVESALEIQREKAPDDKLGEILVNMGAVKNQDINDCLQKQKNAAAKPKLGEVLVGKGEVPARDVAQALRIQKQRASENPVGAGMGAPEGGAVTIRETVKVDAHRLDQLVDMIGELVIAESMVCQSRELVNTISPELSRHVSQLDKITRELQEMAMGLRMVPVRSTFQKMARLVRDLARKTGKEVSFNMQGEDTELDKTVVDRISDPLVHMVRNSVDHGLEANAEQRREAGKTPVGNVTLSAYHSGGNIHIEISDDGRGLDRDAILSKARERGLIEGDGELMSDGEVWQLIFEPGFSTAKQLTEVSGRGVGMDVVRRNIEALRGEVDIHSEKGSGSRFIIKLPLTLAIIDGMIIRVANERYIIPTLSIVVSVRPEARDIHTVAGVAETMKLQGELIPLFRLYQLFDLTGARTSPMEGTVVVLENGGKRVGLLIDEILGQQQIVIKSLGESLRGARGIAGGAIMPDGKVGLIIDVAGIVKLATETATV